MRSPKIGLALGSGSARGLSHIGVIRALAAMGIEPQLIAGCSVGAMVGGAYAAGHLDDLQDWLCGLSRMEVLGFFDVSFSSGGVILGERLAKVFHEFIEDPPIESLALPFAAVATDLASGREIWFQRGSLIDAVRASMSLPGLFAPVALDGRWLVDGGLVNPVPVSICRAMGADLVVAVNLNGRLVGKHFSSRQAQALEERPEPAIETVDASLANRLKHSLKSGVDSMRSLLWDDEPEAPGLFDVMAGTVNIMQDRITRSRMAGDPPDLMLMPRVDHIGLLEIHRAEEIIKEGQTCVERHRETIRQIFQENRTP
jgi:NTE family protein